MENTTTSAVTQVADAVDKLDETIMISMNTINDKLDELLNLIAQLKKGA